MKKVMLFGTFDILHPGHEYLFKEARKYGDYLIVVIARDETVKKVKKKKPKNNENERLKSVSLSKDVDKVVLGSLGSKMDVIGENKPDVICLGYDQKAFVDEMKEFIKENDIDIDIIRLMPYREHVFKGSLLRNSLSV